MDTQKNYYTYRVTFSHEDNEFVGLCAEFPSLSWLDEDDGEAYKGIRSLVADVVKNMKEAGEEIPEPLALKKYSGNILVRTTPEVHRELILNAAESNVSLNRYINSKLL